MQHKEEDGFKKGVSTPEFNLADPRKQLERGLKSRHIQFLALGGFPGTCIQEFI